MNIVWFVGSGFIYLIADIIEAQLRGAPLGSQKNVELSLLHNKLKSLNNLWGQLDESFFTIPELLPGRNREEMLEHIQGIINSPIIKNNFALLNRDTDVHKISLNLLQKEMKAVGNEFTNFERSGGYADINKLFPNLGNSLYHTIKTNGIKSLHVCTTNYDGIFDSLLTYYNPALQKRQFLLKDGFYYNTFVESFFRSAPYSIAHIHGSHRFCRGVNSTVKLGKGQYNPNPVMIYNSQLLKEKEIIENDVLSIYQNELASKLEVCDRVIVLGSSFRTEPHLKRLIQKHFNRYGTEMIVCSDKPEEVASILQPHYSFPIYTRLTGHVKSENQLNELFNLLLGQINMNKSAIA